MPQEPLPALCCIPEPQVLPTEPSECLFWSGTEMAFGFSYISLPLCVCAPPEPSKTLLTCLRHLSMFTIAQSSPSAFSSTLEPSLGLPAPQGILSLSVSPEPSKHLSLLPGSLHGCF